MKLNDIFAHAGRAAIWGSLAKWFDVAGALITFLLMVRLLPPEIFGIWGLALLILLIPETIIGGALCEGLIQRENASRENIALITALQLIVALTATAALIVSAPWIATALGHPELATLVPLISLTLPAMALSSAPAAILLREFRFRAIAAVDAFGTIVAAATGLSLVLSGYGIWSLAWMEFARRIARAIGFLFLGGWPLAARPGLSGAWDLLRFGIVVLGTRLLQQSDLAIPRFFLGLASPAALGYFNVAQRLFQQATGLLIAPFTGMAMPFASRIKNDPAQLVLVLDGAMRIAALVIYPVFMGAAAIAPLLVPLVLGEAWSPAVPAVQLMLLLGVRAASASLNGSVLRAVGKASWHLFIVITSVLIVLVLSPLVARWGASAIAALLLVRGAVTWALGANLLQRATGFPAQRQLMVGWQPMASALIMAIIIYTAQFIVVDMAPAWMLAPLLIAAGAGFYLAILYLFSPGLIKLLLKFGKALVRRDKARMSALLLAWAQPE